MQVAGDGAGGDQQHRIKRRHGCCQQHQQKETAGGRPQDLGLSEQVGCQLVGVGGDCGRHFWWDDRSRQRAHRQQAGVGQGDQDRSDDAGGFQSTLVLEAVDSRDLPGINEQFQATGQADSQDHQQRGGAIPGHQSWVDGFELFDHRAQSSALGQYGEDDQHGAHGHQHALDTVGEHDRAESAQQGVGGHHHEDGHGRDAVAEPEELRERDGGPLVDGDKVESRGKQDHDGGDPSDRQ